MARIDWTKVSYHDVLKAIEIFNRDNPEYPEPKVTFLIYNGKKLPAKHIRGMAYEVAYGKEIKKSQYSGGMETVKFFERLGFGIYYTGKSKGKKQELKPSKSLENKNNNVEKTNKKNKLKLGLYLQTDELKNEKDFNDALKEVKEADFDIFALPEFSYFPFESMVVNSDITNEDEWNNICDATLDLSEEVNKAIIINSEDRYGTIFSLYANAQADEDETSLAYYIKHTMTSYSAFDFNGYDDVAEIVFKPIIYKGYKIGMTICYDCNHSLFSRIYGLQDVDIIINSTGGDVVYDKWYKYNKARAIENTFYNFVTMGGDGEVDNPKTYVYGFNPQGKELEPINNIESRPRNNHPGLIYVYDLSLDDGEASPDTSLNQKKSINKNYHLEIPVGRSSEVLKEAKKLDDNIYLLKKDDLNIIFCLLKEDEIFQAEKVLGLLYSQKIKGIENKRYILLNKYKNLDEELYRNKLSAILKVRAMENFCGVILESDKINNCYQTGFNRTAQVIESSNGFYRIDLTRTTGPEAIWKDKLGMKASWRKNFEWLIDEITNQD